MAESAPLFLEQITLKTYLLACKNRKVGIIDRKLLTAKILKRGFRQDLLGSAVAGVVDVCSIKLGEPRTKD